MKNKAFMIAAILMLNSMPGGARAEGIELERIVVTPYRTEENIKGTTGTVTVFTRSDIEKSKTSNIKDFIKNVTGLDITQAGNFGGPVSVFSRGTNSGQTQIMIDSVRVYDPIVTNGAFNLAHLTLDNVERIEIVNGPQSVLYGSDAMGGVINIITKKGSGKPEINFLSETGSYDTNRQALNSNGSIKNLSYSLGASYFKNHGISKLRDTSEKDPYQNTSVSMRLDYDLDPKNNIGLSCRFTDAINEYDNSVGLKDDPDMQEEEQQLMLSTYVENMLTDIWRQKIQFSIMSNYRQNSNDKDQHYPYDYLRNWYLGENQQFDWQNTIKVNNQDTVICGLDWQREKANYYYYTEYSGGSSETHFPKVLSRTKGYYLENIFNLNDIFHLNAGIRIDDHSYAGEKQTYKIDSSYLFKTRTKIKGGWGTAFKAPTLYQLHALSDPWFGGGNPNLQPEESQTYEMGFEQDAFNDKVQFGLVYFHTQLKNLIDAKYDPSTWYTDQYSNIGKARIFGYESNLVFSPFNQFKMELGYTWQDTEDKSTGDELLKRPKNKSYLRLSYAPDKKIDFGFKLSYTGRRNDTGNRLLKEYAKADMNVNYKLNINTEAFFKIDNITDKIYEETKNYAQPRRSFYVGAKLKF